MTPRRALRGSGRTMADWKRNSPSSDPLMPDTISVGSFSTSDCEPEISSGAEAVAELQGSVKDVIHNMDNVEHRWEARFERVEEDIGHLIQRHEELCKALRDSRRVSDGTSDRLTHVESDTTDIRDVVSELSRSMGVVLHQMKEHRREVQCMFNEEKHFLRTAVQEIQTKVSRMDLDIGVLQSQQGANSARTERVETGMAVLETTDNVLLNSMRRLERSVEELSELPPQVIVQGLGLVSPIAVQRTLGDEIMDADWTDQTTPESSEGDAASLTDDSSPWIPVIPLHISSDRETSPIPVADFETSPVPVDDIQPPPTPLPALLPPSLPKTTAATPTLLQTCRLLCSREGAYSSSTLSGVFIIAVASLTCLSLLTIYIISSVTGHIFATMDNRPIWERSRMG